MQFRQPVMLNNPEIPSRTEARLKIGEANRRDIAAFRGQGLLEGPRPTYHVAIVMLKGAKEETVRKTVESLSADAPKLKFTIFPESDKPLNLPEGIDVVVFVANGTMKGVERLLNETQDIRRSERIGTVLVCEHKNDNENDWFDNVMSFEHAIDKRKLTMAVSAAHYYQRGEFVQCA